jgi:pilus assembly protein CpaD
MVANPEDLIRPRGETPRPGERRDVVWGKYIAGEPTISKRAPSEHANASEVSQIGGSQ